MFELLVLIPLSAFFFLKNKVIAYVTSILVGVLVLSIFSIEHTTGNFNRTECIYIAFWIGVIAFVHAGVFFLLILFTRLLKWMFIHKR